MSEEESRDERLAAYCELVKSFDAWVHVLAKQCGSESSIIESARDSVQRNMASNAEFYDDLAMVSEKEGDYADADRYKLIAKLYGGLCRN